MLLALVFTYISQNHSSVIICINCVYKLKLRYRAYINFNYTALESLKRDSIDTICLEMPDVHLNFIASSCTEI